MASPRTPWNSPEGRLCVLQFHPIRGLLFIRKAPSGNVGPEFIPLFQLRNYDRTCGHRLTLQNLKFLGLPSMYCISRRASTFWISPRPLRQECVGNRRRACGDVAAIHSCVSEIPLEAVCEEALGTRPLLSSIHRRRRLRGNCREAETSRK